MHMQGRLTCYESICVSLRESLFSQWALIKCYICLLLTEWRKKMRVYLQGLVMVSYIRLTHWCNDFAKITSLRERAEDSARSDGLSLSCPFWSKGCFLEAGDVCYVVWCNKHLKISLRWQMELVARNFHPQHSKDFPWCRCSFPVMMGELDIVNLDYCVDYRLVAIFNYLIYRLNNQNHQNCPKLRCYISSR